MNCKPTYKGVRYNSLEELKSSVITPQQKQQAKEVYQQYINSLLTGETISNQAGDLSKSQVKNVVYHFSNVKIDKLDKEKFSLSANINRRKGFFGINKNINPGNNFANVEGTIPHAMLFNMKNPDFGDFSIIPPVVAKDETKDSAIIKQRGGINYYTVFEPSQIHIMGSKSDIEQVKEFINNKRKIGINENNRTRKSESTSASRENDTNGRDYYLSETFKEASENFIWSSEEGHRYNFGSLSVIQGLAGRARNIQKMVERRKERLDWDGNEIEVKSDNTSIQKYSNFSFGKIWEKMGKSGVDLEANIISSSFVVQRALQESNKFYSRIRESIEREFNISIIGEISLDIDSPPLWANTNHIAVNLYKIDLFAKKHKNYTDFIEEIDKGIEEEIIHIAINNLTTDSELLQVFDEMTEDQKQDVKKVYKKKFDYRNKEDQILMVHEFIRMIIQDKYTSEISESSNPTLFGIINRLLNKVKEWLGAEAIKTNEILNRFDKIIKQTNNIEEKSNTYFSITPEVDFNLRATQILSSPKADEVFRKGDKNNWDISKILQELQIPKEQKQLIESIYNDKIDNILKTLEKNCE